MLEAYRIVTRYAARVCQLHVSEVTTGSSHARMSAGAVRDFRVIPALIPALIPADVPVIVESVVRLDEIVDELRTAREALGPVLQAA